MSNKKVSYSEMYLSDFTESVQSLFEVVARYSCDVIKTLDTFLGSSVFSEVYSRANPRYLNMGYKQLLDCLVYDDNFDWEKTKSTGKDYDSYIMWWVGMVLTHFQWKYRVDFIDWLKYFSVEDVYNMYYPLHEASISVASDKLYENYLYKKENKMFRKK